jgi:transcriptional regulator GlxA family with amidase domain
MKSITILVPETAVPAAVVDPQYMFSAVNEFFRNAGHQPFFQVQTAGVTKEVHLSNGSISIFPDKLLRDIHQTDLIIIPAISGDVQHAIKQNREFFPWIVKHYKQGAEVASLCIGAFLLASTGLLQGKSCSTHWLFVNTFRSMFPDVTVAGDRVITEQNGIYSSGGASSYWSLLLYLVEKYAGREMAIMASKFFLLDMEKNSQLPFTIFRGQKEHGDELVLSAQHYIEEHYSEKITIDYLADRFGAGRRTFERRFKKATTNSIVEYIQRVKIEAAKKQLELGRKNVHEVMYEVGYNDTKAFRDVFKKLVGMSPVEYRTRYSRSMGQKATTL